MRLQTLIFTFCFTFLFFLGCESPEKETNNKIDKTADTAKELIDIFSEKAKEIANDDEFQDKLKSILKDVEVDSKDLQKLLEEKGDDWKKQLEKIKNDPKLKEQLKNLSGNADDVLKKLEKIFEEVAKEKK